MHTHLLLKGFTVVAETPDSGMIGAQPVIYLLLYLPF